MADTRELLTLLYNIRKQTHITIEELHNWDVARTDANLTDLLKAIDKLEAKLEEN